MLRVRIIWAAMLVGVAMFAVILLFIVPRELFEADELTPSVQMSYRIASIVSFIVGVPIALFARGQIFKRHWVADAVTPEGYLTGNMIAWAVCEGVMFFSVLLSRLDQFDALYLGIAGATGVLYIGLWPNGKAMLPQNERGGAIRGREERW